MKYLTRIITSHIQYALNRGKSVLLLGARQTGKTTLIHEEIKPDLYYSFIQPAARQMYEQNPSLLAKEIEAAIRQKKLNNPCIVIDEVQKVPLILDVVQDLIDRRIARFILTGSSARKLKRGASINLLPGRVVLMHLYPLSLAEMASVMPPLKTVLLYGSLPGIFMESLNEDKNTDLDSYVKAYVEDEVRAEAVVRNIGHFSKFLFLAANESGQLINFSKLSQAVGVAHTTISAYFQILEDCLLIERIEPLTHSTTRARLSKAPKFIFFDLGVRRLCAEEGVDLPLSRWGHLFEQWVGLELIRSSRLMKNNTKIFYWRDHAGPEVDYVIQQGNRYTPVEVKWNDRPTEKDCRHLVLFLKEYPEAKQGYIVCQTERRYLLADNITAIPWQEIESVFSDSE